jgi:MerR family mercuric resistance operon transcriptional regulator
VRKKRFEDDRCTIGELSACSGVNIETIRYYERISLLPQPPRTRGGHRAYGTEIRRVLGFIKRARELGFNLEDIRALLALRSDGCCNSVKTIASRHLNVVQARIRDLVEMEKVLVATLDRCPGDGSTECPMLDVLNEEENSRPAL